MRTKWLVDAREALSTGKRRRALELIEEHALQFNLPPQVRREALALARRLGDWYFVGEEGARVERLVKILADWRAYEAKVAAQKAETAAARKAEVAAREAEVAEREAEAAAAREAARERKPRREELFRLGLTRSRVLALQGLTPGPYDVELLGIKAEHADKAMYQALADLGYLGSDQGLLLERVIHIAPEIVAYRLHQSEAVKLKIKLEACGGKIRITQARLK